jgi:NTE family protein
MAGRGDHKTVNLALQGGGSHGAFAWGVLDRLLEDERIDFEGITATSAGAMNATVTAYGLAIGGREGAKRTLAEFWQRISRSAASSVLQPSIFDRLTNNRSLENSPAFIFFDMMTRLFSPYQFNPFNFNPLRDVLEATVDFDRLRKDSAVKLFLCASNIRSGKVKIFRNHEITASAVLASGCLPFIFQAVEIDGEAYWDGGYTGNPTITPLVRETDAHDSILVQINPRERQDTPRTAADILNRLNEISFNSPLMKELRMIAVLRQVADPGTGEGARWARMRTHRIMTDMLAQFGASSKLNAEWKFIAMLRAEGRRAATKFLDESGRALGKRSTTDLDALLMEC